MPPKKQTVKRKRGANDAADDASSTRKATKTSSSTVAPTSAAQPSSSMSDQVYCFTGFRDSDLEQRIIEAGGKVASSVTKAVQFLVVQSTGGVGDSSKVTAAKAKGIKIVSKKTLENKLKSGNPLNLQPKAPPVIDTKPATRHGGKNQFTQALLGGFWEQSDYANSNYKSEYPTDAIVAATERQLGYTLPDSYVELMRSQNGGFPSKKTIKLSGPSGGYNDGSVEVSGIFSIGKSRAHSLCGRMGSSFWMKEWKYPKLGVYIADCPSGGHDMFALDYRKCGKTCKKGEPSVVHIDQECDYAITPVAETFLDFVKALRKSD